MFFICSHASRRIRPGRPRPVHAPPGGGTPAGFRFECRNCRKVSEVDVLGLIERYGATATVGEIRDKARCRICKKRTADVLMRQPGSRKDFGWWPRPPRATR